MQFGLNLALGRNAAGGGGAPAFSPSDISNAVSWWSPRDGTTHTFVGSGLSQVDDKIGSNHLTQSTASARPEIVSIGGVDYFDMIVSSVIRLFTTPTFSGTHSLWFVASANGGGDSSIWGDNSSNALAFGQAGSTNTEVHRGVGTPDHYLGTSLQTAPANRGEMYTFLEPGSPAVIGLENFTADGMNRLGKAIGGFASPDFGDILLCTGTLSSADRTSLVNYWTTEFGL